MVLRNEGPQCALTLAELIIGKAEKEKTVVIIVATLLFFAEVALDLPLASELSSILSGQHTQSRTLRLKEHIPSRACLG